MSTRKARRALRLHTRVLRWLESRLGAGAWVADDPSPEYSRLDRLAGLGKPLEPGE